MRTWSMKFTPEEPTFDIKHNLGTIDVIIKVSNRDGWPLPFRYTLWSKDEMTITLLDESIEYCLVNVTTLT